MSTFNPFGNTTEKEGRTLSAVNREKLMAIRDLSLVVLRSAGADGDRMLFSEDPEVDFSLESLDSEKLTGLQSSMSELVETENLEKSHVRAQLEIHTDEKQGESHQLDTSPTTSRDDTSRKSGGSVWDPFRHQ